MNRHAKQKKGSIGDASSEKQIYDLKQLLEISKSLNSVIDFSTLIEAILYTCMGQMKTLGSRNLYQEKLRRHELSAEPKTIMASNFGTTSSTQSPRNTRLIKFISHKNACITVDDIKSSGHEVDRSIEGLLALQPH